MEKIRGEEMKLTTAIRKSIGVALLLFVTVAIPLMAAIQVWNWLAPVTTLEKIATLIITFLAGLFTFYGAILVDLAIAAIFLDDD